MMGWAYTDSSGREIIRDGDAVGSSLSAAQKRTALDALVVEINSGVVDDEACARRLAEIGATEEELEALL